MTKIELLPERLQDVTLAERLRALHARLDAKLGAGFIDDIPGDELSAICEAAAALSVRGEPVAVGRVRITEAGFVHISSSVAELGNAHAAGNGSPVFAYATPPSEG